MWQNNAKQWGVALAALVILGGGSAMAYAPEGDLMKIKGYSPEEIIGEHFSRFYTDEDRAVIQRGADHCGIVLA